MPKATLHGFLTALAGSWYLMTEAKWRWHNGRDRVRDWYGTLATWPEAVESRTKKKATTISSSLSISEEPESSVIFTAVWAQGMDSSMAAGRWGGWWRTESWVWWSTRMSIVAFGLFCRSLAPSTGSRRDYLTSRHRESSDRCCVVVSPPRRRKQRILIGRRHSEGLLSPTDSWNAAAAAIPTGDSIPGFPRSYYVQNSSNILE